MTLQEDVASRRMQNGREGKGEEQMKGSEGGRELASTEIMKSRRLCVQHRMRCGAGRCLTCIQPIGTLCRLYDTIRYEMLF